MAAKSRATLIAYYSQRGLAGMDVQELTDLFDSIVVTGETGATMSTTDLDLGASGTAGSLDIFPATGSKGKVAITKSNNASNDTTSVVFASQAAAQTMTVPDPLASADFILGKQAAVARTATSDGLTTGTIAAAGKIQSITVTSADANNIIVLPTPTPGTLVILANGATGYELRTTTPASIAINGGADTNAESAIAASSVVFAYCATATTWLAFAIAADGTTAGVEAAAT